MTNLRGNPDGGQDRRFPWMTVTAGSFMFTLAGFLRSDQSDLDWALLCAGGVLLFVAAALQDGVRGGWHRPGQARRRPR